MYIKSHVKKCYNLMHNPNAWFSFCIILSKKRDDDNKDDLYGVSLCTKTSATSICIWHLKNGKQWHGNEY